MKTEKTIKEDNSKRFLLKFFKDSRLRDINGVLTVSNVPADFEKFIGKRAPYKFVFDINLQNRIKDSELIMQGSYFLLAIKDYLSDKGQTSLLKLNIIADLRELSKKSELKNYKILKIKSDKFDFLYGFSFLSKYQYLNNKKQSTNTLFIKDKEILDFDITKFKTQKGNTNQIPALNPDNSYEFAIKKLEKKVKEEIKPLKLILKEKLRNELSRIKEHYKKQIYEKDEEVEACANKIKMLQSKLRHTSYDRDISILNRLIKESKERLEMLQKKGYRERLKAEEKFHITDEVEKHVLSIINHLINVTVYYYPLYELQISKKGKTISLNYDPILDKLI